MKAAATQDAGDSDDSDNGQPRRVLVQAGAKTARPATTAARSVFDLVPPPPPKKCPQRANRLPRLDISALKPTRMAKPPATRPPSRKGSLYDQLFEVLQVGEMFAIDLSYQSSVRRVMVMKNRAGSQKFSIRVLNDKQFGLWRDQ